MINKFIVLIVYAITLMVVRPVVTAENQLPSSLQVCHTSDKNLNECLKNSIQNFLPSLRNNQIFSIDPVTIDKLSFNYKNQRTISASIHLKDAIVLGLSRGKIQNINAVFPDNNMIIQADVFFKKVLLTGVYKANVIFNSLKMQPRGQFNVTVRDMKARLDILGKLERVENEDFMKIYDFQLAPDPKEMKISISGIFPDPELNRATNEYLNQQWRTFSKEIFTEGGKQWTPILIKKTNQFFEKFAFRRLFIVD